MIPPMAGPVRNATDVQNQNTPNACPRVSSDAVSATVACSGGQRTALVTPTAASDELTVATIRAYASKTMQTALATSPQSRVWRRPNPPTMRPTCISTRPIARLNRLTRVPISDAV